MIININIDTSGELTASESAILAALSGNSSEPVQATVPAAEVEEKPEPKRRGRPRKTEPTEDEVAAQEAEKEAKLKAAAEAKAKAAEEKEIADEEKEIADEKAEAAEEAEESEPEDDGTPAVLEGEDDEDAPTLEQAVGRATELISAGKAFAVKGVLTSLGVKKVGELPSDKIQDFLDDLENV